MSQAAEKDFIEYCAKNSLRVTPPRMSVFKIVANAEKPVSAYDVLELMSKDTKKTKPPTAYRALDFLTQHGFIHRIESMNAYVPCNSGHKHKGSQFMICDICGHAEEMHLCSLPESLQEKLCSQNFSLHYWNFEAHGTCSKCSTSKRHEKL